MAYSIRRAADGYQLSTNQKPVKIDPTMEVEYLIGIQKEYFLSFIIATTWYNQESGDTIFPNSQFLSALKKAILWHIISIVSESFSSGFFLVRPEKNSKGKKNQKIVNPRKKTQVKKLVFWHFWVQKQDSIHTFRKSAEFTSNTHVKIQVLQVEKITFAIPKFLSFKIFKIFLLKL